MASSSEWLSWALLSAVFAALTAIFAKVGIKGVDSDLATFVRTALLLPLLGLLVHFRGKWSDPFAWSSRTWLFLALSAAATGASWLCYFRALQLGPAAKVAPVDKLSVVLVALFAVLFLGERPTGRDWAGLGLVAVGVVLLAWKRS